MRSVGSRSSLPSWWYEFRCLIEFRLNEKPLWWNPYPTTIWLSIDSSVSNDMNSDVHRQTKSLSWLKSPQGFLKCNVRASWINSRLANGVSWLVCDHYGKPLFHSRRSYFRVETKLESDLLSLLWALESLSNLHLKKFKFECSSEQWKTAILHPH